jgi:hypothetical protein
MRLILKEARIFFGKVHTLQIELFKAESSFQMRSCKDDRIMSTSILGCLRGSVGNLRGKS